jgi:hypothetical protein
VLASPPELGGKPLQFHDVEEPFLNRQFEILAKQSSIKWITYVIGLAAKQLWGISV